MATSSIFRSGGSYLPAMVEYTTHRQFCLRRYFCWAGWAEISPEYAADIRSNHLDQLWAILNTANTADVRSVMKEINCLMTEIHDETTTVELADILRNESDDVNCNTNSVLTLQLNENYYFNCDQKSDEQAIIPGGDLPLMTDNILSNHDGMESKSVYDGIPFF
jgi:hypothetical protein